MQRRRPRMLIGLAVFAVAGGFSGAAVSGAAALTTEPPAHVHVAPPTTQSPEQLAGMVRGDTELFGSPFILDPGTDTTTVDVGTTPDGATELFVAFGCADAGTYAMLIDGIWVGDSICDGPGGGGGGGYPVAGEGPHWLSVEGPGDFVLWASWTAPSIPPEPSTEQAAALADGVVTEAEYRAGFDRYRHCMDNAGYPLQFVDEAGAIVEYSNFADAVESGSEAHCYASEFYPLDMYWQVAQE